MARVEQIELGDNNVYLVEDEGNLLAIDCGPDYEGAWEVVQERARERRPERVVATHGHLDHAGLGSRWQEAGVPVAVGLADQGLVSQLQLSDEREFSAYVRYAEATGAPPEVVGEALGALAQRREWARRAAGEGYPPAPRGGRWPTSLRMSPFVPAELLEPGRTVEWGSLRVLPSPGHTRGNLVVVSSEGWLFSGDQLLPGMTPTPAIQFVPGEWRRFASLTAFVASLRKLRQMGLTLCYPGHGGPFKDVTAAIDANLAQVEQRADRVLAILEELGQANVYEVAQHMYPRALGRRFWQIVATVQGHLDLLVEERRAGEAEGSRYTAGG